MKRERERAVGRSVKPGQSSTEHTHSFSPVDAQLGTDLVVEMNQSDFYKMQKLNFDREKHRGYWNIGEMQDMVWTAGPSSRYPPGLFDEYKISS